MKVVGITSCPSGVAHTYMAAEALKLSGQKLGIDVIIETQGGAGVENQLKQKDIDEAACVILVNDVALEGLDRFKGKKVLKMGVSDLIKKSDAVMKKIQDTFQYCIQGSMIIYNVRDRTKRRWGVSPQGVFENSYLSDVTHIWQK